MRLRLGLLNNQAAIDKAAAQEAAEAQAKKHKHEIPTAKTKAQTKADEAAAAKEKEKASSQSKPPAAKPRIRPLSEAKAIDTGANFISETFIFSVGAGLILFESWRSRRKETSRREDVAERMSELEDNEKAARRALVELEKEILRLRAKEEKIPANKVKRILPKEVWELEQQEEKEDEKRGMGWLGWLKGLVKTNDSSPTPTQVIETRSNSDARSAQQQPNQTTQASTQGS